MEGGEGETKHNAVYFDFMPITKQDQEKWQSWIDALRSPRRELTSWESDFIDSIETQIHDQERMSEKQAEILERIYAEKSRT